MENLKKFNLNKVLNKIKTELVCCTPTEHEAEQQALWILEEITKKSGVELLSYEDIYLTNEQEATLEKWVSLRVNEQMPIQYLLGHMPFLDLDILIEPPILIPRQETEEWVADLIKKLEPVCNERLEVLDIGTGSGCIALSLAKALPNSKIFSVDINSKAIELAKKNAKHNKINNANFFISDFYSKIPANQKFDLIVSNPPYISDEQWNNLDKVVRHWEDYHALVSTDNGFESFKTIIFNAKTFLKEDSILKKNGVFQLVLECGMGQNNKIVDFLESEKFYNISVCKDLAGIYRWIGASF